MIKTISITGGIGSGKSTVIALLSQLGYCVWDADIFSAEAITKPDVESEIRGVFGNESYLSAGVLNRAFVRERVFATPKLKETLENILHPVIQTMLSARIEALKAQNVSCWIFYEASLIFETKRHDFFDANILVTADDTIRIKRVQTSKKLSADLITKIMTQQMPTNKKIKLADHVIENNGTKKELETNVLNLIQFLKKKFKK